jgi:hypothetical protein
MRVLIVNYEFPPIGAGGGQASQKIAECLVKMGHEVRVITSRPTHIYVNGYRQSFVGGWILGVPS